DHESVLKKETIESLNIKPNGIYVDCTLGRAGHALEIVSLLNEEGLLIGFDQDSEAISAAKEILPNDNVMLIHANFNELKNELLKKGITEVDGVLFDLGVRSPQLDQGERGFSYQHEAKLEMRREQRRRV